MAPRGGPDRSPTVAFVYPNPRRELRAEVAAGRAPDTTLLGQNHLAELGLEARIHDPPVSPIGGRLLQRALWNLRELGLPWQLGDADVVITPLAQLFPLAARARRRPRVVVVNYGLCTIWARSSVARRRLLEASLRSAGAVVCLGEWQRQLLLRQTRLSPERVSTVLLGADERYFAPLPAAPGEPIVFAVGKDLARDYKTFAAAVERLDVRVEIATLPRNLDGVRLPPNARVRFPGPWSELRAAYARAGCVVIPQRRPDYPYGSEGGGLTALLEAMAMARPIVATDRPILHEYVEDGETAVLVPPEDPEALAAAIARVLAERAPSASLGAAARARVEAGLTTRHFARAIAPILRAVAR